MGVLLFKFEESDYKLRYFPNFTMGMSTIKPIKNNIYPLFQ
jgi:hypothetical protein